MTKPIFIITFLLISYVIKTKAQVNCDTSLLIKSFAKIQFDHSGARDLQEYKCLKNCERAKKYLLKLLKKEWNKEDYIEYVYKIVNRDSIGLHNETMRLIKKDSSRYKTNLDFLQTKDIQVFEKRRLNERASGYLIEIVGYLYYKESIPILKKLLSDPNYPDYAYKIKLSLARLGDIESENDVIKLSAKDTLDRMSITQKWLDIVFIRSQKGFYILSKLLKSPREEVLFSEGNYKEKIAYDLLKSLKSSILNKDFQNYFEQKYKNKEISFPGVDDEDVQFAIQWFEKNKGKYLLIQD